MKEGGSEIVGLTSCPPSSNQTLPDLFRFKRSNSSSYGSHRQIMFFEGEATIMSNETGRACCSPPRAVNTDLMETLGQCENNAELSPARLCTKSF